MYKKNFTAILLLLFCCSTALAQQGLPENDGKYERQYLVNALTQLADPVLNALSQNKLKQKMLVEKINGFANTSTSTYLEAFGRLVAGMAPWLELGPDETAEGQLRKKYIDLIVICLRNGTDSTSPDYLNFNVPGQSLVDAAFLTQALLRAPKQIWGRLDDKTKANLIACLKATHITKPPNTNWLLFSAIIEAGLLKFSGDCDQWRIDSAIAKHKSWYKGDGAYGDGPEFHWDYYNSFVIQPMLLDVLQVMADSGRDKEDFYDTALKRSQRYAAVQERFISPEGTYPPIGRSLAYRFGAFQLLSQIALMNKLPSHISPQQVRAALYTVIKKQLSAPGTFDKNGWLQIGIYGHQPGIGETYISTGSLYLCSQAFLILGIPATDPFWNGKDKDWTSKKVWKGEAVPTDHAE